MSKKHQNKTNPCSRVLGEIAQTCFLIGEETDFQAHFNWAAHVNQLTAYVVPAGATGMEHAIIEIDEYINIPTVGGFDSLEFRTDTYPKVKAFSRELKAFYEQRLAAA